MDEKSIEKDVILKELDELHNLDHNYADGKILGSMCTEAHPFAKEIYLSIEKPYSHVVTGSIEANLMAIQAAKNHARKYKRIMDGEIIVPESAHFSFKKSADMLNLKIVEADLDDNYKINVESVKRLISDKTVAIAGTTELGLIDPIEEISKNCS